MVPSALTTFPLVVYWVPGARENHLLSMTGASGKAALSKLMADPGPHSSVGSGASDADSDAVVVPAGAVVVPDGDAEVVLVVAGVCPGFGAAHDATVAIATRSVKTEPKADSRLRD